VRVLCSANDEIFYECERQRDGTYQCGRCRRGYMDGSPPKKGAPCSLCPGRVSVVMPPPAESVVA
jgi:hypothetical protein